MRMTILYTVIQFPQWQLVFMYSMAPSPPTPLEDKFHLKHFTWGFLMNAAICLSRESYLRERTHEHAVTGTRARTHSLHTKIITLQVHQACFQRFGGIWFLLWGWGRGGAAEVLLWILGRFFGSLWTLLCEAGGVSCIQSPASLTSLWLSLSHQSLSSGSCCP